MAISVELGLLPPDTYIPTGATAGRKKGVPSAMLSPGGGGFDDSKGKKKKRKRDSHKGRASESLNALSAKPSSGPSKPPPPPVAGKTLVDLTKPELSSSSSSIVNDLKYYTGEDDEVVSDHDDNEEEDEVEEEEESEEERDDETIVKDGPPEEDMDPERSLFPNFHKKAPPATVHWDPNDRNGSKIGWRVRVEAPPSSASSSSGVSAAVGQKQPNWLHGRVVRYDPYTHKHKIQFDKPAGKVGAASNSCWIWLRNEQRDVQLATRIVWAHVKGYAWWPALVMESLRSSSKVRDGYVSVEFFGSAETATLRDSPECIRPFRISSIDEVVAKHKKKRNAQAYQLACEEYHAIRSIRNDACLFYAERALELAQTSSPRNLVGKRVEVHRTDINYPYGDTLSATVRAYSFLQKKWLLAYEYSNKTKTKYDASWMNLGGKKECSSLRVLDDKVDNKNLSPLVPYLVGFEAAGATFDDDDHEHSGDEDALPAGESNPRRMEMATLLAERCRGCVEYWKQEDIKVQCRECRSEYHIGCTDPPISMESWQRMIRDDADFVCGKCVSCRGCYQKDICFGCHPKNPPPPTLSFPKGESLNLCFACSLAYDEKRYCPNCAHSWDHDRYEKQHAQLEYAGALYRVKGKFSGASGNGPVSDTMLPPTLGSFAGDSDLPVGAKVDPSYFYAESTEWGFSEVDMLVCDGCDVWVHAGCSGLTADEYEETSDGRHPIYSKEFLCRMCCRNRCKELISLLNQEDRHGIFAAPVTEKVAPTYRDVIRNPMDLETMLHKAVDEEYLNYAWIRELFELMVLNALTFNRPASAVWHEAKRYYRECLSSVFLKRGKAAPPGEYAKEVNECFEKAEEERKKEEDRVQVDETVEKKDLVAGSMAASVTLPKMRKSPPDQSSCLAFAEIKLEPVDAFYCSWMECCYVCASSGAMDTMLFCVDCGEAYHAFCANAPIHSMDEFHATGWRCPNCKICEISGEVPQDENRMLFCEMCDRAFSTDLLDPPLTEAPPGLWICGQCVDCSVCRNTADGGSSLKHWSQDPHRCFRCGGCGDVVADYMDCAVCVVSKKRVRADDLVVQCASCNGLVRTACNEKAKHFLERYGATGSKSKVSLSVAFNLHY
jgi:Bromodomain/PWWP domain/PHD-finger